MAEGLDKALALTPGSGWAEVTAGLSRSGAFAQGEIGAQLRRNLGVFGFGRWTSSDSTAGVGARFTW